MTAATHTTAVLPSDVIVHVELSCAAAGTDFTIYTVGPKVIHYTIAHRLAN